MKTILLILVIVITLAMTCTEKRDCADSVSPEFTPTELAWFSFEPGDSIVFKDARNGELYYMKCTFREMGIDTLRTSNEYCERGVDFEIFHYLYIDYNTNIDHENQTNLFLWFYIRSYFNQCSLVSLEFRDETFYLYYSHRFLFNNSSETLEMFEPGHSIPNYLGSLEINGKMYENVYSMRYNENGDLNKIAFYDSIYYNHDGILKLISSEHGYRLERME